MSDILTGKEGEKRVSPNRFKRINHSWGEVLLLFHCPGCGYSHPIRVEGEGAKWEWNGDLILGTFTPSLLVNQHDPEGRCHSYVRNGEIQFLDDCFHDLKGQTVDIPRWETSLG